jgi:proteasome lid subunit RPN8/RPN11
MPVPDGSVDVSPQARDAIHRHAVETYPHECCGALLGRGDGIVSALPLPNTTEEGPRRRFLIRPDDYRTAERAARAAGLDLLGFYHSHPDHPARPSQHDLDHAWPNLHYIIASVLEGRVDDVRTWFLRDDRSAFDERPLLITADA